MLIATDGWLDDEPHIAHGTPTITRWQNPRKHRWCASILGYAHIPQFCASLVNAFCADHLNHYVNFYRPCFFPKTITDAKGKERKKYLYKDMMTP